MNGIFDLLYFVVFLSYLLLSVFIVYHLLRYSGNRAVMMFTVTFFALGTFLLLVTNMKLYHDIPFDSMAPKVSLPNYSNYSPQHPFGIQK